MIEKMFSENHYCPEWAGEKDWLGRRLPMSKTCPTCPWAVNVKGKHPQDGTDVDQWNCAIAHGVLLQMEQIKIARHLQAGIDKLHNGMTKLLAESILRQERQHREAMGAVDEVTQQREAQPAQITNDPRQMQMDLMRETVHERVDDLEPAE